MDEPAAASSEGGGGGGGGGGGEPNSMESKQPRRRRTKGLMKKLQEQVEFYFGDANLPKDKFLQQKIKEHSDGYVSVELIASFKKMKALTDDIALIQKAMQSSPLVQLSQDKLWVKRASPLPDSMDVDLRTIYVEKLSEKTADHNSLKKLFSVFGHVVYVSLPRYKTSGMPKGFAFIEFSSPEEARAAVEQLQKDKLSQTPTKRKPSTACDPQTKTDVQETEAAASLKRKREDNADEGLGNQATVCEPPPEKRVKVDQSCVRETEGVPLAEDNSEKGKTSADGIAKECALAVAESSSVNQGNVETENVLVRKRKKESTNEEAGRCSSDEDDKDKDKDKDKGEEEPPLKVFRLDSQSSELEVDSEGGVKVKRKKNRQHRKRDKWAAFRDLGLRVMGKTEWLQMKKLYRDMQRDYMKQLKAKSKEQSMEQQEKREERGFVSNCLVKVECKEDSVTANQLHEMCSKYGDVAYVDYTDGEKEGYLRYCMSGCVQNLVASVQPDNIKFSAVDDEEERAYFLKTQAARKQLRGKTKGKKRMRGHDKIISKALKKQQFRKEKVKEEVASSHIHFSDSENSDTELK